jgi:hypothetical protein
VSARLTAAVVTAVAALAIGAIPAGADVGDGANGSNNGQSATGTAQDGQPGGPGGPNDDGGDGGPNCTKSDGTRDYYRYEGLQFTTEEEQRTTIRPDEQRPGDYFHVYCGDEYVDFLFFADGQPVDPTMLARSVTITPPAPQLGTSPAAGDHLVGIEAWFWVVNPSGTVTQSATAGGVTVTVTAEPRSLIVDPGDNSGAFTCPGAPPAYDPALPAGAQSSDCTHTYSQAGNYTATARLVYDVSFTSNIGVSGDLDTIEPSSTLALTVNEAQAIVVD